MRFISTLLALLVLLATNSSAWADWTLDNAGSQLSFVTVKAQDVAEVHTFSELSGAVGADGRARVLIQLASVDTLIPIRDERMRDVLFNTELFPTAAAVAQLDMRKLQALAPSTSMVVTTEIMLSISDTQVPVAAELLVSRLAGDRMLVATLKPVIVNAASVSLAEGVEQLREIAGLPSISKAVPVSFVLQFVSDR